MGTVTYGQDMSLIINLTCKKCPTITSVRTSVPRDRWLCRSCRSPLVDAQIRVPEIVLPREQGAPPKFGEQLNLFPQSDVFPNG